MSAKEARKVVSRAIVEADFRERLYSNPGEALSEYDLTQEENDALRAIPAEFVENCAETLPERLSMSIFVGTGWVPGNTDAEAYLNLERAVEEGTLTEAEFDSVWQRILFKILGYGGGSLDRQNQPLMD